MFRHRRRDEEIAARVKIGLRRDIVALRASYDRAMRELRFAFGEV